MIDAEQIWQQWVALAQDANASDLHVQVGRPPYIRRTGQLEPLSVEICTSEVMEAVVQLLLSTEKLETLYQRGDVDCAIEMNGQRMRTHIYQVKKSWTIAIRFINTRISKLSELGLPAIVKQLSKHKQGIILVVGPTGSGKSTTLAAMIDELNQSNQHHIVTLEDPIETIHPLGRCLIHQREIGQDTPSFAVGLRAAMRQDPDIIMVGELRDLETMETAINAAETGHLVLATLHTANAMMSVDRIIDMFPAGKQQQIRIQLSSALLGVIAQRLLPRSDQRARIGLYEVLVNTPAVANCIRNEKTHQLPSIIQTGRASGMQSFKQAVENALDQGFITQTILREEWTEFSDDQQDNSSYYA